MTQRDELVRWARAQVGKPYRTYRDCSGFTAAAYRQIGVTIPEGSVAQFDVGRRVKGDASDPLLPADLMFWATFGPDPGHVGIYIGDDTVVHALNEQRGIVTSNIDANMGGKGYYMGARRLLDATRALPEPSTPTKPSIPDTTPPARPPRRGPERERERNRRRFWQRVSDTVRRRRVH